MLKRLAILGELILIAAMTVCASGQPNETANYKRGNAAESHSSLINPVSNDEQNHSQPDQANPGSEAPKWNPTIERPEVWWGDSNWWLVIVGGLTGIFIGWQAWLLRRTLNEVHAQAGHMEIQTKLLEQSLGLVIQKEKPRLLILNKVDDGVVSFYVLNKGQTPARIGSSFVDHVIQKSVDEFPEFPTDFWVGKPKKITYLLPGDSSLIDVATIPKADDGLHIWFFGVVRYIHVFSASEYDLRFCYKLWGDGLKFGGRCSLDEDGPPTYLGEYEADQASNLNPN